MSFQSDALSRGKIVRIRVQNFMTYDDTEMVPGPNLNMILGPNGTGKSAFVCCMIVGLAGEVNLTGRGGSPADFVKKGRDTAITEIELFNDLGSNYTVTRKITITARSQHKIDHKSDWKINGKTCLKAAVTDLTKELNIKVDNLCQFLPQDSVTQFVKMNTCELLLNTLKAAGDNQLVEDHHKLVTCTKDVGEKRQTLEALKASCKENEINAQRLESEVHQLRERETYVKQKAICSQKLIYVKYLEEKEKYDRVRAEREQLREQLATLESNSEPYKRAVEFHKSEVDRLKECICNSNEEVRIASKLIQDHKNSIENRKVDCQAEFAKFKGKQSEENEREGKIKLKQQELQSLECKLNSARDVNYSRQIETLDRDIAGLKQKMLGCSREKSQYEDELRNINTEIELSKREIEGILAVKEKKISLLRARFQDAFRVLDWLSRNKSKFREPIYMPMMVEINVKDPNFSRLVENSISINELTSFVCVSQHDLMTFTRAVRDELNTRFNVILAPETTLEEFKQESHANPDLKCLNVRYRYLIELIDAPEPILRHLCGNNQFHRVPALDSCGDAQLKYLLSKFSRFYVGHNFYQVTKSRFDNNSVTVNDTVRDARYLTYSLDSTKLAKTQEKLKRLQELRAQTINSREELLRKEDELKREWHNLVNQRKELNDKQEEKLRLESGIKRARDAISKLQTEKIDIETERKKLQQSIDKISRQIIGTLEKLVTTSGNFVEMKELHMINILLLKLAERSYKLAQKKYNDSREDTTRLQKALQLQQTAINSMKNDMNAAKTVANDRIPGFNNGRLDDQTQDKFDTIAENTREELEAKKSELQVRIQRIYNDQGNTIMNQYKKQTEEVKEKQIKIAELEASIGEVDGDLTEIKKTWLPRLEEVIKVIDKNYKDFMQKLRYDGQVKLDFDPQRPNSFDLYGIKIFVKYRDNEALEPLSSTRQSGGERSVATMIYMLALQTKTTVPFRCVDEINQGMDKDNERKVFELLVKTADSSSSQYFLVSPKLLSNLPYSKKMKIHIVFNGKKQNLHWINKWQN